MSTPNNFRLPINVAGKAEPEVVEAIGWHDDAINDLQQAIPELVSQISAIKAGTSTGTGTTTNVTSESTTVIVQASTVGVVNDQTGNTAYSTQQSDYGAEILLDDGAAIAVTLTTGAGIQTPWFCFFENSGAGTATLTPASGTINGSSTLGLATGYSAVCFYDGTNFWAIVVPPGTGSSYVPQGGTTGARPGSPTLYQVYFDTTLGIPIWWSGSTWVNASGVPS